MNIKTIFLIVGLGLVLSPLTINFRWDQWECGVRTD